MASFDFRAGSQGVPTSDHSKAQGKTPWGLIKHVLAVLVFWSQVLLMPGIRASSRSLKVSLDWHLLRGPFEDILGSDAPSSPATHAKMGRTAHVFALSAPKSHNRNR